MILAGIDEAGYGPLLGPLVVGCCAFEIEDGDPASDPPPCLWKRLRRLVSKNHLKSGRKLHVNDSKVVYSPSTGLKELERSILAICAAQHGWSDDLHAFLGHVAAHVLPDLREYDWYVAPDAEPFPIVQDKAPVQIFASALRQEMEQSGTRCLHLAARLVPERQFNRMLNSTRNKASTLFSLSAMHLDHLLRTWGHSGLVIVCDRQGGREHYGSLLRLMFEDWSLEIISEADGRAEYRLHQKGHVVRIIFSEKAEGLCMSVAVASMLSKYLREAMMRRFNEYWRAHIPDLAPTAGYYGDGERFLRDIEAKRRELRIADQDLIRSR